MKKNKQTNAMHTYTFTYCKPSDKPGLAKPKQVTYRASGIAAAISKFKKNIKSWHYVWRVEEDGRYVDDTILWPPNWAAGGKGA